MSLNWITLATIGVILVALLVFLVVRNKKDRKEFETKLNQNYKKPHEEEHTADPDDLKNI